MRSQTHILSTSPTLVTASADTGTLVEIAASGDPSKTTTDRPERELFARLRRFRGDADAQTSGAHTEDEVALKLQVVLLSEENARLKAARHRPSDIGTLIDQMRQLGAQEGENEMLDEAWTMLSECLLIREGLDRACIEIQSAIGDVRARLGSLAIRLDDVTLADASDPHLATHPASLSA
jgi:hypothetical protein